MGINDIVKIGGKIKELRKSKGFSQRKMAEILEIPYSTYSNYENNNREPSRELLIKIASVLDVDINALLMSHRKLSEEEESTLIYKLSELVATADLESVKQALQTVTENINNGYLTFSNSEPTDEDMIDMFISRLSASEREDEIITMLAIKTAYSISEEDYLSKFQEKTTDEIVDTIKSTLLDEDDLSAEYEEMALLVIRTLGLFNTLDIFDNYKYYFNQWNLIENILGNLKDMLYKLFSTDFKDDKE